MVVATYGIGWYIPCVREVCGKDRRTDSALEYGTEQVYCRVTRDLNNRSLCVIIVRRTCPFEADLSPDR